MSGGGKDLLVAAGVGAASGVPANLDSGGSTAEVARAAVLDGVGDAVLHRAGIGTDLLGDVAAAREMVAHGPGDFSMPRARAGWATGAAGARAAAAPTAAMGAITDGIGAAMTNADAVANGELTGAQGVGLVAADAATGALGGLLGLGLGVAATAGIAALGCACPLVPLVALGCGMGGSLLANRITEAKFGQGRPEGETNKFHEQQGSLKGMVAGMAAGAVTGAGMEDHARHFFMGLDFVQDKSVDAVSAGAGHLMDGARFMNDKAASAWSTMGGWLGFGNKDEGIKDHEACAMIPGIDTELGTCELIPGLDTDWQSMPDEAVMEDDSLLMPGATVLGRLPRAARSAPTAAPVIDQNGKTPSLQDGKPVPARPAFDPKRANAMMASASAPARDGIVDRLRANVARDGLDASSVRRSLSDGPRALGLGAGVRQGRAR